MLGWTSGDYHTYVYIILFLFVADCTLDAECYPTFEQAIDGSASAVVVAYGSSGSGKTHSLLGQSGQEGLAPRVARIFLKRYGALHLRLFEVYNNRLCELTLSPASTKPAPVANLIAARSGESTVTSWQGVLKAMTLASERRVQRKTCRNLSSSRSHLFIGMRAPARVSSSVSSWIYLVDIAGHERLGAFTRADDAVSQVSLTQLFESQLDGLP